MSEIGGYPPAIGSWVISDQPDGLLPIIFNINIPDGEPWRKALLTYEIPEALQSLHGLIIKSNWPSDKPYYVFTYIFKCALQYEVNRTLSILEITSSELYRYGCILPSEYGIIHGTYTTKVQPPLRLLTSICHSVKWNSQQYNFHREWAIRIRDTIKESMSQYNANNVRGYVRFPRLMDDALTDKDKYESGMADIASNLTHADEHEANIALCVRMYIKLQTVTELWALNIIAEHGIPRSKHGDRVYLPSGGGKGATGVAAIIGEFLGIGIGVKSPSQRLKNNCFRMVQHY